MLPESWTVIMLFYVASMELMLTLAIEVHLVFSAWAALLRALVLNARARLCEKRRTDTDRKSVV